jgi:homoserine dehydrogenase
MFYGQGAGQMPTASAVVADMIDTAVGRAAITFRTLELWSNRKARVAPREHAKADGRFYLRVNAEDHPGVQHNISISSVLQQERASADGTVPLVIMTHLTTEGATRKACSEINKLTCVRGKTIRMWVRD